MVSRRPVARSTRTTPPVPDSSTQSFSSCQRGEWGIDRPRVTNSPDGNIDDAAAVRLVGTPAVPGIGGKSIRSRPPPRFSDSLRRAAFDGLAVGGDGLVQLLLVAQDVAEAKLGRLPVYRSRPLLGGLAPSTDQKRRMALSRFGAVMSNPNRQRFPPFSPPNRTPTSRAHSLRRESQQPTMLDWRAAGFWPFTVERQGDFPPGPSLRCWILWLIRRPIYRTWNRKAREEVQNLKSGNCHFVNVGGFHSGKSPQCQIIGLIVKRDAAVFHGCLARFRKYT